MTILDSDLVPCLPASRTGFGFPTVRRMTSHVRLLADTYQSMIVPLRWGGNWDVEKRPSSSSWLICGRGDSTLLPRSADIDQAPTGIVAGPCRSVFNATSRRPIRTLNSSRAASSRSLAVVSSRCNGIFGEPGGSWLSRLPLQSAFASGTEIHASTLPSTN